MGIIEVSLIGIGLSMDASAVSMSNAMAESKMSVRKVLLTAFLFGIFQAIMPTIGYFAGSTFSSYIEAFDHWIAFVLLAFIGVKMIVEAIKGGEEHSDASKITFKLLIVQSIATSIDALAVGVSFSTLLDDIGNLMVSVAIIGTITFLCSLVSSCIGKKFGAVLSKKAEIFGGLILVFIGVKILLEHLIAG